MKYRSPSHHHESTGRTGLLVINLGTPDSPAPADVRRYLKEFLWDPRVVEIPRPLWWPVLNLVVLNTRPRRSAAAYARIWTEEGSPLLTISRRQVAALKERLDGVEVVLAMRYGNPSIRAGLETLEAAGMSRILVLPLYPQYSATTTASTFDAVTAELRRWRWLPELRFVKGYHDRPGYIQALAGAIRAYWQDHGEPERLVFSFHGLPRAYADAGDPYPGECRVTARLLAERLGLQEDRWVLSFQSRLGPKEWLKPYTSEVLGALPAQGVRRVQVVCPGFSADCLETLEEIAMENRDVFMQAGGQSYGYIPCLNDTPAHMDFLAELAQTHLQGWERGGGEPAGQ